MNKEIIAKQLQISTDLDGITLNALSEHFKLYEGYVKKVNEIQDKISTVDKSKANSAYSEIGELKRQESFSINGVRLHEIYFDILGGDGKAEGEVVELIKRDFGSMQNWISDMTFFGLSSRGWVITYYDLINKSFYNYSADSHNIGIITNAIPIIALDVYEHAYFMDYGTNRKNYIEAFFKNLNWNKIDKIAKENGVI